MSKQFGEDGVSGVGDWRARAKERETQADGARERETHKDARRVFARAKAREREYLVQREREQGQEKEGDNGPAVSEGQTDIQTETDRERATESGLPQTFSAQSRRAPQTRGSRIGREGEGTREGGRESERWMDGGKGPGTFFTGQDMPEAAGVFGSMGVVSSSFALPTATSVGAEYRNVAEGVGKREREEGRKVCCLVLAFVFVFVCAIPSR